MSKLTLYKFVKIYSISLLLIILNLSMDIIKRNQTSIFVFLSLVSIFITIVYILINPEPKTEPSNFFTKFIIKYFHSICWLFLSIGFLLKTKYFAKYNKYSNVPFVIGGIIYLIYIITFYFS